MLKLVVVASLAVPLAGCITTSTRDRLLSSKVETGECSEELRGEVQPLDATRARVVVQRVRECQQIEVSHWAVKRTRSMEQLPQMLLGAAGAIAGGSAVVGALIAATAGERRTPAVSPEDGKIALPIMMGGMVLGALSVFSVVSGKVELSPAEEAEGRLVAPVTRVEPVSGELNVYGHVVELVDSAAEVERSVLRDGADVWLGTRPVQMKPARLLTVASP